MRYLVALGPSCFLNQRLFIEVDGNVNASALIVSELNLVEFAGSPSVRPRLYLLSLGLYYLLDFVFFAGVVFLLEVAIIKCPIDARPSVLILVEAVGNPIDELLEHLPVA